MAHDLTNDDLALLLERLAEEAPGRTAELHNGFVRAAWEGVPIEARVTGTNIGKPVFSLSTSLGAYADLDARIMGKLLEHVAGTAASRVVVDGDVVQLETRIIPDDITSGRLDAVVSWRLAELCTIARAWRRHLGLGPESARLMDDVHTLADLIRTTPVAPQKALLVATVGFAVAGADGYISPNEASKLRAWMREIPSFAALDLHKVVDAIATLVDDPARTLLEALRRLDPRERLLAWALANDMAHADGFTSADERQYLSTVASIFQLSTHDVAPFVTDAQERSVRRETLAPPSPHPPIVSVPPTPTSPVDPRV